MTTKPISSSLLLLLLHCFVLLTCCSCHTTIEQERSKTNGMFVFGSSLVDNGNNIFITRKTSKANYMPYGIDFPLGPTGRFSNGKNILDALGDLLKLPSIPAYRNPATKGSKIVNGVDFASGGSGILDETGSLSGGHVITLNQQIGNFKEVTLPELKTHLGSSASLTNYLFVVATGGNDYQFNYFLPGLKPKPSLPDFTAVLTQTFSTQIQKLYSLGARKFVLISVYPLGCVPYIKNSFLIDQENLNARNEAALLFNTHLKSLVDDLKLKMPGSALVYVDSYKIIMDLIQDPVARGFNDATSTCCEVLLFNKTGSGISCKRDGSVCDDRRGHVFFDGLHPTEAANDLMAKIAFTSNLQAEVYPINVQQLAELRVESEWNYRV